MKYPIISVMENKFGVIFGDKLSEEKLKGLDFEPIFILPGTRCDFDFSLPNNKKVDNFYLAEALSALQFYFFKIRALPPHEIEISHSVSNFTVKNLKNTVLKREKCKYNFTKNIYEIQGVNLECFQCDSYLFFPCESVEFFDVSFLNTALIKMGPEVKLAVAYSFREGDICVKRAGVGSLFEAAVMIFENTATGNSVFLKNGVSFSLEGCQKLKIELITPNNYSCSFENKLIGFVEL